MRIDLIDSALEHLRQGRTLLYPTDTIWGIGCDACCRTAVDSIYAIKKRDPGKAMLVLANEQMISPAIPQIIHDLLHDKRPTTVILPKEMLLTPLADNIPAGDGTVGVRIPHFDFCQSLLAQLGHPIVSTSANLAGKPSPSCYEEIDPVIKRLVDYALPNDVSFSHSTCGGSRIVKVGTNGIINVIRG